MSEHKFVLGQSPPNTHQLLQLPLSNLIKIRDFAFPFYEDTEPDPRHFGLGTDAPRVNQLAYLIKRLGGSSSASSSCSSDSGSSDDSEDSGFNEDEQEQGEESEDEGEFDDEYDVDERHPDTSLSPGLYRSLYPFSPEAPSEMALVEGQVVRVIGKGSGDGWAIVVVSNDDTDDGSDERRRKRKVRHALVPESYLEAVRLDEWEQAGEDEDEGGEEDRA